MVQVQLKVSRYFLPLQGELAEVCSGTGLVVESRWEDLEAETLQVFKIAVLTGRFDHRRNAAGELWVTENEILPVS